MDALALKGDVPSLSAFYHKHAYADTTTNKKKAIIHAAMSSSHVPVLDWLVATATDQGWVNTIWTGKTWVTAAHAGHVAVLAWAHAKGLLNLDTFTMELRLAATAGHVPVLEWIHQQISVRCPYSAEEVRLFPRAANNGGRANILQWRWNRVASHSLPAPAESAALVDVAMLTGNMDTVRWWWATFERHRTPDHRFGTAETTLRAVSSGSLSLVKWLWAVADANSSSEYFTDWSPRCPFDLPTAKEAPPLPIPGLSWTAFIWRGRHRYGGHILKVFTAFLAQNTNTSNSAAIDRLKKLVDAMVNETPLHVLLNTSTHNTEFHATAALLNIARSKIDVAITAEVEIIACLPDPKLSLALGIPRHDMSNDGGIPTSDWPKLHPDLHARLQAYFDYQKRRARESDGLLYDDDDEDCGIIPAPPAEAFYFARITPDEGGIARCTDWGAVSSTGTHIKDPGYPNDQYLQGFRRGWYDDVYWRVVGDYPSHFLAGAVAGNDYKYQIPNRLFGINRRCAMITVPGEGIVFCRGVSGGEDNPAMACVLFNDNGSIREERALERRVRHWNDLL